MILNSIRVTSYPNLIYRTRLQSQQRIPTLRGHSYYVTGNDLFHFEPNSAISRVLSEYSIDSTTLDPLVIDYESQESRQIFSILVYKALRRFFKSKGYICGSKGGRRGTRYQNICMERSPFTTVQSKVYGRCHQAFQFHLEFVRGQLALTLVPQLKLTTSFLEAARSLGSVHFDPHTFVSISFEQDEQSSLSNTFLSPHRINGKYLETEPSSDIAILHLTEDAEAPLDSLYVLLSPKDQGLLGLSEQFGNVQTHRYSGQIRESLSQAVSVLSQGRSWTVNMGMGTYLTLDPNFMKV